jgi:hypothetical protein
VIGLEGPQQQSLPLWHESSLGVSYVNLLVHCRNNKIASPEASRKPLGVTAVRMTSLDAYRSKRSSAPLAGRHHGGAEENGNHMWRLGFQLQQHVTCITPNADRLNSFHCHCVLILCEGEQSVAKAQRGTQVPSRLEHLSRWATVIFSPQLLTYCTQ